MAAASLDILIEQGTTFSRTITIKDDADALVDLTGESYAGQVRLTTDSAVAVATFTCTVLNQVTNKGEVLIELTPTQTSAIPVDEQTKPVRKNKDYAYDIERTLAGGAKQRILQGIASVSPEATKV